MSTYTKEQSLSNGLDASIKRHFSGIDNRLTFEQWQDKANFTATRHPGGAYVVPDFTAIEKFRAALWNLSDYVVSSVTGGSIWLVPRHQPSLASVLSPIGHYKVSLRKFRSTWNWFTTNPKGGGFGSNIVGSKKSALKLALKNIPVGSTVEVVTENEGREVGRVTITIE